MKKQLLWRGKGPIMYAVDFYGLEPNSNPELDAIDTWWKYLVYISGAGRYSEAVLGDHVESFGFFANTKDEAIRDLAKYIDRQLPQDTKKDHSRKIMSLPPQPLSLDNVEITDNTDNNDFRDIDVPSIFANIKTLSDTDASAPGARPFIVSIRDTEESPGNYDIYMNIMDPVVIEEFEFSGAYDFPSQEFSDNVPAKEVNKTIKDWLSHAEIDQGKGKPKIKPNPSNTKLINFTKNPEFTLNKLFAPQLKIMQPTRALHLIKKAPNVRTSLIARVPAAISSRHPLLIHAPLAKRGPMLKIPPLPVPPAGMEKEPVLPKPALKKRITKEHDKKNRLRA